jgi:uncharacterized protein (TIGR00369 family)
MTPGRDELAAATDAFAKASADGDLSAMSEVIRENPVHRLLGLNLLRRGTDSVTMTMELSDAVEGGGEGSIHGGILATFADAAAAVAIDNNPGEVPVTTDLHVRYYRQPRSGPLTAEARVVHRGRRLLSTECVVTDPEQRVLARTTATYMIVPV